MNKNVASALREYDMGFHYGENILPKVLEMRRREQICLRCNALTCPHEGETCVFHLEDPNDGEYEAALPFADPPPCEDYDGNA